MVYIIWILLSAFLVGLSIELEMIWCLFIPSVTSFIISLIMGLMYLIDRG